MTPIDPEEAARKKLLFEEKQRLSELPYFERDASDPDVGVLLSDRIRHYCGPDFQLISPMKELNLQPAAYGLRVGDNYTKNGERYTLNSGGVFEIEPYRVAIIQTLETLNLPDFLIGRWNIQISLAYKGLVWVGGAQVDPGFRGRLNCPIYNLSSEPVRLSYGDKLAVIDFVTTTPFLVTNTAAGEGSQAFQWWRRAKLFQEYNTSLQSGVAKDVQEIRDSVNASEERMSASVRAASAKTESKIDHIEARNDAFVVALFTVVAVLFAGLGVVATKGSDEASFFSSTNWVAAVALYFALRAYLCNSGQKVRPQEQTIASAEKRRFRLFWKPERVVELAVATLIVLASIGYHLLDARVSAKAIHDATEQAARATSALDRERGRVETEILLRQQADARLESLQQQLNALLKK